MEIWKPKDGWRSVPWLHVACFISGCLICGIEPGRILFLLLQLPLLTWNSIGGLNAVLGSGLFDYFAWLILLGTIIASAHGLSTRYLRATVLGILAAILTWGAVHSGYYNFGMLVFERDPTNPYASCHDCFLDSIETGFGLAALWLVSATTLLIGKVLDLARKLFRK